MKVNGYVLAVVMAGMLIAGCTQESNPLAPYEGERPLVLQRVTVSATPDIQWVGGRVAAVGVNRGSQAALDETLIWLVAADDDMISSHVSVGQNTAESLVEQFGGVVRDSLLSGEDYTIWLAEASAFDADLAPSARTEFNFVDTTLTLRYELLGGTAGDERFISDVQVIRDQRLQSDAYEVTWTPAVPVRQIAVGRGRVGGFADLIWHIVAPEGEPGLLPPLVFTEPPAHATVAVPWPETGFEVDFYTLWMTGDAWNGSFSASAPDYAFFRISQSNFE